MTGEFNAEQLAMAKREAAVFEDIEANPEKWVPLIRRAVGYHLAHNDPECMPDIHLDIPDFDALTDDELYVVMLSAGVIVNQWFADDVIDGFVRAWVADGAVV